MTISFFQGSKIRVDFLDFKTEGCCDRVLLVDGIPSKSDLVHLSIYPFDIDTDNNPFCPKTVQKQKTRNKQNKRKVSGNQKRGLVSKNAKIDNHGTKNSNPKKTETDKNNQKRREDRNNQKNQKSNLSKGKGSKKVQTKRVSNKQKQTVKKGSKQEKRGKIPENVRKPFGKPVGTPGKPTKKPGVQQGHRNPGSNRIFNPDQIIAVSHIFHNIFCNECLISRFLEGSWWYFAQLHLHIQFKHHVNILEK